MNRDTLDASIEEAERFLKLAKACRYAAEPIRDPSGRVFATSYPPRESGAYKRASMDLTRALANLRRAG